MPIDWKTAADYDGQRKEAERRIAARDPHDWPTVALALDLPVWSQDKDLTAAGLDVFTTGHLLDAGVIVATLERTVAAGRCAAARRPVVLTGPDATLPGRRRRDRDAQARTKRPLRVRVGPQDETLLRTATRTLRR